MIALVLLCAWGQGTARPGTLPPEAELADRSSIIGMANGLTFSPELGGLNMTLDRDWDLSQSRASDAGLMVNLRTGELNYVSAPDLMDRQIICPSAVFVRSYRSELAKTGKHSPGLPDGWVHNYDLIIKLPADKEKWQPVTLTYPNKAQELIEPELDDQGSPTGKGRSLSNATYDVSLVPGEAINTYKSLSIVWPNSHVRWYFEPHSSGVLVLRAITSGQPPGGSVRLSYLPDRTLAGVASIEQNLSLMSFTYAGDLLATTYCRSEYSVGYTYNQLNGKVVLWKVSEPFKAGENPRDGFVFSYATEISYPALAQIAIPDGNGWSKSRIEYADGRITAVQGASGVRQEVGSSGGGRR
jgi:hypothetical protein